MSAYPWLSLHPDTRDAILDNEDKTGVRILSFDCGCQWQGPDHLKIWLCQYHSGFDDGRSRGF